MTAFNCTTGENLKKNINIDLSWQIAISSLFVLLVKFFKLNQHVLNFVDRSWWRPSSSRKCSTVADSLA